MLRKQKAVSLIALIITIIVIIILAAVVIGVANTTPENANKAKFIADISNIKEAVTTKLAENHMQFITNPDNVDLNAGFTRIEVSGEPDEFQSFALEAGEEGTVQGYLVNLNTIKMENASIGQGYSDIAEVVFGTTDVFVYDANGEIYYAKGYKEGSDVYYTKLEAIESNTPQVDQELIKGANEPILSAGMKAVYWEDFNEIEDGDEGFDIANWYDYTVQTGTTENGGTSKWANAKLDGSYFVWIPRYAYKITYYTDATKQTISATKSAYGDIDILFVHGISSTKYINKETSQEADLPEGYTVHPVFTNNTELGGWDSELTGIWVAKYEACRSDATNIANGTSTAIKVVPGVKSYRSTTIGTMHTSAIDFKPELNSHIIKNSEWGAVAYLTHSKYGRNGTEVTINNNSNLLTGYAGDSISAGSSTTNIYPYNTAQGALASTTGNIYGIYDMVGGAWEDTCAYYSGGDTSYLANGAPFVYTEGTTINTESTKYAMAYAGINLTNNYIKGDSTYETGSWNGDYMNFIAYGGPWFIRGGDYHDTANAGVFASNTFFGSANVSVGFRIALSF